MPRGELATLIGDVVESKQHPSRTRLQREITSVLGAVNELLDPVQPLEPTVGDEFQGCFASVADAALASLVLRLRLLTGAGAVDSRYGLGWGEIEVFERHRAPISQDGPGWWSARAAIDRVKVTASKPRTAFARTCFEAAPETGMRGTAAAALDAFLLVRDSTVGQMNERQRRLLLGLLSGFTQEELAAGEGVTQGAVSQALRRSGALAVEAAQKQLAAEDGA
jgi:hypothetical protein